MNLIGESAQHLFDQLKSLEPKTNEETPRVVIPAIALTSVKIATEIRELCKLQLDVYKFVQETKGK